MVQQLISQIIGQLRSSYAGIIDDTDNKILDGPSSAPAPVQLPLLALYMGEVSFEQHHQELSSSNPRPMELRERLPLNLGEGPYQLAQTPLDKSVQCKVQLSQAAGGRRRLLQEGRDFTIDYQNAQLQFLQPQAGGENISLRYSYVGVFTVREFQQEIIMDVFDDSAAKVENWATLSTAMVLTNHNELLDDFNLNDPMPHIANGFVAEHSLSQIVALGAIIEKLGGSNLFKLQMKYSAKGQVKYIRTQSGSFGIIENIHSPGVNSVHPVDIDIELE